MSGAERSATDPRPAGGGAYDYRGRVRPGYAPRPGRTADPGEVVWAWVPFQEDPAVGKDRPLLVIGQALDTAGDLAALPLSSRDRSGDPHWVPVGSGGWDPQGRASWVALDRPLAVAPRSVRRVGAALDKGRFDAVLAAAGARPRLLDRLRSAVRRLVPTRSGQPSRSAE